MALIALIEVFASYISGFIVLKYNILHSIKYLLNFSFVLYLSFYFLSKLSQKLLLFIIFLSCKLFSETIYNIVNIYTPKIISEKYTAYFFIFGRLFSRVMLLFLPHVNYLFNYIGIHPFVFLSVAYGLSRVLIKNVKEPTGYHQPNRPPIKSGEKYQIIETS